MAELEQLARPEIRSLSAYVPAVYKDGLKRLNANEAPWRATTDDTARGLNRYPEARPGALTQLLSEHYGCETEELFVTRGTSEAIDLLIRCFCRPGVDRIVTCPPTFGMYQVYAGIQNAAVDEHPLRAETGYSLPVDAIVEHWSDQHRLVFVTTPNNPTGHALEVDDIARLAGALRDSGLVVVDGAYAEFADAASLMALRRFANVVVLRTMSKAYGLAGARCGALIADKAIVRLIEKVMPPYAIPTPSVETAMASLINEQFELMPSRIASLVAERERVAGRLATLPGIRKVWPSDANFLLVEFDDPQQALTDAESAGYLLRDFSGQPLTKNCIRITIGEPADNDRLLDALGSRS